MNMLFLLILQNDVLILIILSMLNPDSYKFVHNVLDQGARVCHDKAKFVQIVLELVSRKNPC